MSRETQAVTRRAGLVGACTFASRILGFIRDAVIMHFFAGQGSDIFVVAFTFPNTLRRLTAEGSLAIAFVPVFTSTHEKEGHEAARRMFASMTGVAFAVLVILVALGIAAAPAITYITGAGFARIPGKFEQTVSLLRYFFPYLLFVSLTALAGGALNSYRRFFAPAFAPVLLNISIITSIALLSEPLWNRGFPSVFSTAPGVLAGGTLQLLLQIIFLKKSGLLVLPAFNFRHPGVIKVLKLTAPMVLGAAAYQVMMILSRLFSSLLPEGTPTYIYIASRLVELPQAVFATALATAALPTLSRYRARNNLRGIKTTYIHALGTALYVALPACTGLVLLGEPVISVLYQRGEFTLPMMRATAETLKFMSLQVLAIAVVRQTVQVFYANENTKIPVLGGIAALIAFTLLSLLLMYRLLHVGLALAMTLAATAQAAFLVFMLRRMLGKLGFGQLARRSIKWAVASAVMGAGVWYIKGFGNWETGGNSVHNILVLAVAVTAGVIIFFAASWLLKIPEFRQIKTSIFRRGNR